MLNNEFATGFNKFGKMKNYHEFPFLLGITFHSKMINYNMIDGEI
jgi:hypothetical protein